MRPGRPARQGGGPRTPFGRRGRPEDGRALPQQKLTDALMGILSGCKAIYETNFRVRPHAPLQRAFGRERCADQSTIQRTLDALTARKTSTGCARLSRRQRGTALRAAFPPLRAQDAHLGGGPHGLEGLQEGRALHERLLRWRTQRHGAPAGEGERVVESSPEERARTLIRLDGGFGTDENVGWLCSGG